MFTGRQPAGPRGQTRGVTVGPGAVGELRAVAGELGGASGGGLRLRDGPGPLLVLRRRAF
jgi:hypothetical protein